jgi:hypothetical protein
MVDQTTSQPQNPYALFDPTQWSNAYSNYNNQALPWPSRYAGLPTNSMGQPIALPAGTTLNSAPAQPPAAAPQAAPQQGRWISTNGGGGMLPSGQNYGSDHPTYIPAQYQYLPAQQAAAAPQAHPAATSPVDYNTVLSMLANPGKVTTPGATVAQQPNAAPNAAGLQSFLAGWKPAQSGPGSGFQQGFSNALKGMGY